METAADIATAKRELRRSALARRAGADRTAHPGIALADIFFDAIAAPPRTIVAGYWPIRDEIDPRPLLQRLHSAGHACALCVIVGPAAALRFRAWEPGMGLEPGDYGTSVPPVNAAQVTPEVVLTPLLAFDERGHRLGYGGGYYDRTLAVLRANARTVLAVGLAFEAQRVSRVPNTPGDARLDWVVTEVRARRTA